MKLAVGFLTYNGSTAKYLPDFLPSLKEALAFLDQSDYKVLAFDNSDLSDDSNRRLIESFNLSNHGFSEYLRTAGNLGFSRAYNILINSAARLQAEYFLIINPDTLLEKDAISRLAAALDKDQELAAVSPKIRHWDFAANTKTKIIDSCGLILKNGLGFKDLGQGQADDKRFDREAIIGPSGAAGLFRMSALESIKENGYYFDEDFFMYKEDCDLAYRLFINGFKAKLIPEALVYHDRTVASSGAGILNKLRDRRKKSRQIRSWSFRNQHLLFVKHWPHQNFIGKAIIIFKMSINFIFALILEKFLLKEYHGIVRAGKH